MKKKTKPSIINFKVPIEMKTMIECIRKARAEAFEATSNTSIAKDAIKALFEKVQR